MIPESGIYTGTLRHRRFRPRSHEFEYGLFMAWLDVDKIPELMAKSPWTSYNRFNWASYQERDHFGDAALPLRERLARDAREHGVALPAGPIYLLTHLRYFGYCFNPISFYFCYDPQGELNAVLAEVNSTFGETSNYWLSANNQLPSQKSLRYRAPKKMHVSPFMGMDLDYEFSITKPGDRLVVQMNTVERNPAGVERPHFFDATLALEHRPWSALTCALVRHPWITAKVVAAIHFEALRLFLKRVPLFTHPARLRRPHIEEVSKS
jgi:uncharacterized protein